MKKTICLSLILMLLFLAACSAQSENSDAQTTSKPVQSTVPDETEEVVSTAEINYYELFTKEDAKTVESFAAEVRQQIVDRDWESLSDNILFPITISNKTYNSKKEFLAADWDSILSEEFFHAIEEENCENLFCNYEGVMLGNGEVWVSEQLDDNNVSCGLKVIAINT